MPLALVFAMGTAAAVPESPEIRGKVLDAVSGLPIAGAIVVANIGGDGATPFGHGRYRKLHCTAVRADAEGRFRIPAWTWSGKRSMSLDRFGASLIAYHPGYNYYIPGGPSVVQQPIKKIPFVGTLFKVSETTIPMHRFTKGDNEAWDFKLRGPISEFGCDWDADVRNEDLLWDAMLEEVETYDAANPATRLKPKLEFVTKRPEPNVTKSGKDIQMRNPAAPGSNAPVR